MVLCACVQMALVHTQDLSRWRGGGFGMYSEFHPAQHDAWLEVGEDPPIHFSKPVHSEHEAYETIRPHLTFPQPERLQGELETYAQKRGSPVGVQIVGLRFDLSEGRLGREPVLNMDAGQQ